ncbi:MAG: signal peptidase I [Planctomyces sp.]|nr:signal peptidase I [Planctomyces sp.]
MTHSTQREQDFSPSGWLRQVSELIVCFVIAVMMLRAFVLEGYLISTGSMAPRLLGFHKHVLCPTCQFQFAFGVTFDESVDATEMEATTADGTPKYATCPNCGQTNISVTDVPTSHGDQLLIQKHVFDFRMPKRWETVVFRNPASPGEAYVKRIIALPGERIQVVNGDIQINGSVVAKNFETQLDMRIPVADLQYLADSPLWEMPWEVSDGWTQDGMELVSATAYDHKPSTKSLDDRHSLSDEPHSWIRFRNWRWSGGLHRVESPLRKEDARIDWKAFLDRFDGIPVSWASRVEYDPDREVLRCQGVMPGELVKDLTSRAVNDSFKSAVFRLAALSHLAPVTDRYGYNSMVASPEIPVNDLMLSCALQWSDDANEVRFWIPLNNETYEVRLNPGQKTANLRIDGSREILASSTFELDSDPILDQDQPLRLDASNFDGMIQVAVQGIPCIIWQPPAETKPETPNQTPDAIPSSSEQAMQTAILREQQSRWKLAVDGPGVRLRELKMFRDVQYTPGKRRNAVEMPYEVPEGCYFVQGDNSPVSSDSRNWEKPAVPHRLLLGKPFIVHLPSRPAVLEVGTRQWPIRVPEWSRIRYIH